MRNWALIDTETNIVKNIVVWDGEQEWFPSEICLLIECTNNLDAEIGGTYINDNFVRVVRTITEEVSPPVPPSEVTGNNGPTVA